MWMKKQQTFQQCLYVPTISQLAVFILLFGILKSLFLRALPMLLEAQAGQAITVCLNLAQGSENNFPRAEQFGTF